MLRTFLHAKIHAARVTEAKLHYRGSITIDRDLLRASGILPYERVQVVNIENGERFETYVITGEPGSGTICLNGAAARLVQPGDRVIIMAYAQLDASQLAAHEVTVVIVGDDNRPAEIRRERLGDLIGAEVETVARGR